jgi:hypothetical protein
VLPGGYHSGLTQARFEGAEANAAQGCDCTTVLHIRHAQEFLGMEFRWALLAKHRSKLSGERPLTIIIEARLSAQSAKLYHMGLARADPPAPRIRSFFPACSSLRCCL